MPRCTASWLAVERSPTMTDTPRDPSEGENGAETQAARAGGPAQWVPKGALSRFLLQGAAWAFVAQLFALVGGFASQVFLARLLPPEALGIYFLTQSLVIMIANIGEFGLNQPVARMISTDVGAGRVGAALRVLTSSLYIGGISGFVVVMIFVGGAGEWLALSIFDSPLMASAVGLVGVWVAARIVLNVGSGVLQGMHRVGLSALLNSGLPPTALAVICGLFLWTGTTVEYERVLLIASGATFLGAILCVVMVWLPFSGVRAAGPPRTRTLVTSALPIFAAGMLQVASIQADIWIVGAQLEASDIAFYGAAKRLTVLVGFPLGVLSFVVPPLIADLYSRGERERLQRLVRAATTAASLPAAAAFVLFMFFGAEILSLVFGEAYAEGATILKILIADKIVFLMMGPGSLLLVMTGHERVVFRITIVTATVSLLAIYVGGLIGGLVGVAVAYAVASSATGLWYFLEAHRQTGIWVHASPLSIKPMLEVIQRMTQSKS
jgi:O-antigen/teichoic acid export membrane protein